MEELAEVYSRALFEVAQERDVLDDVRDQLGVDVPEGEYVTLGGFLFDAFGHIPEEGERLNHDGWEMRVAEMDRRRVAKVVVQAVGDPGTEEEPSPS